MEIFPAHVRDVWNKWEVRILVILSLAWQVILIIFGSKRKHARGSLISSLVWVTYLSADWLATVSLGTLANNQGSDDEKQDNHHALQALWAPFLLLHLGGPDTITAYSLEDNSLWLRHLLGLLVQVTVALYVYLRSWSSDALTFIAIPVFISGIVKYGERTWALRSVSPGQFEDSLLSAPILEAPNLSDIPPNSELEYVYLGFSLFSIVKRLYANLSLRFVESQQSNSLMVKGVRDEPAIHAFKLVEVQLGFLYDILYTKACIIYSLTGVFSRLFSVISMVSALAAFLFSVKKTHHYSKVDISITYALFIGAVSLELYAILSLVFSDWTLRWLIMKRNSLQKFINWVLGPRRKRWSGHLAQQTLLSFCINKRATICMRRDFLFKTYFMLELYWQRTWEDIDDHLKELIFQNLLAKHRTYKESGFNPKRLNKLLSYRDCYVKCLKRNNFPDEIAWSVEVEFDHGLLIWHVATDICYQSTPGNDKDEYCKASKKLCDYMLYVLLMRPFMLPKWTDRITRVRDTFKEAMKMLQRRQFPVTDVADASRMLVQMYEQHHRPLERLWKEKSSQSVLADACRLASQLRNSTCSWEMICQVWIEMLIYAAGQCDWTAHAQQLRRGGEFLTHVCLLTADLGLSEQLDVRRKGPPVKSLNEFQDV